MNILGMYEYFARSPSPVYHMLSLKAYKSMAVYQSVISGSVDKVEATTHSHRGWAFVRGQVRSSQKSSKWNACWILINRKTETIRACRCGCPAGGGEACSHVAPLCFYLILVIEHGLNRSLTVTDVACQWLPPKTKNGVKPGLVSELLPSDNRHYKRPKLDWVQSNSDHSEFLSYVAENHPTSRLHKALRANGSVSLDTQPVTAGPIGTTQQELAETVRKIVADFIDIREDADVIDTQELLSKISGSVTETVSQATENATVCQAEDGYWEELRWGRVTASKADPVYTFMGPRGSHWTMHKRPKSALNSICPRLGYLANVPALKWGREHEEHGCDSLCGTG